MNSILIPRNLESRLEKKKQIDLKRIQEYIKNGSKGELSLRETFITKLPDNLVRVGGHLYIYCSSIEDLNNLEYVWGNLWADNSKLKSLPTKLTQINHCLSLTGCPIDNIDNLKRVGGSLWINGTNINELPEGLEVRGNIYWGDTPLFKRFPDETSFERYLEERNIKVEGEIFY